MQFTQFNENPYKYDLLAENIYSREQEWFHYDFDKQNFEQMLLTMPAGQLRTDMEKRLADTITQMTIVDNIHSALLAQIVDQEAYAAAVIRAAEKRAQAQA